MKKFFYSFFAAVTLMFAASSCSSEDVIENGTSTGDAVEVSFNLEMEGQTASRAIGDGLTVDELYFAVYDVNGNEITNLRQDGENAVIVNNLGAVVKTRLVKGQTYQFVFWAQKKGAGHYNTDDMKAIKVNNYTSISNDESRDAFYAYVEKMKVTGSFSKNVTLKRPFAQLNLGTSAEDWNWAVNAGVTIKKTAVKVKGAVYTTLNTFDDSVADEVEVDFALNTIPDMTKEMLVIKDSEEQFENDEYYYLSSSYLLAPAGEELSKKINFTLVADDDANPINSLAVLNAPLQRNWRTNIVGDILTGEGTFNIVIDPIFEADRNYPMDGSTLDIWDGKSTIPGENSKGQIVINEASDLIGMAEQPYGTYNGKTIVLTRDLSFKNVESRTGDTTPAVIKPVFKISDKNNGVVGMTFLGNGHVIRDFIIDGENNHNSLFGIVQGNSRIENLTIINADVKGLTSDAARAAIVVAKTYGKVVLENVTVKDSKLQGVQKIGGLIGYAADNNKLQLINCTVDGLEYSSIELGTEAGSTGGLVGFYSEGTTDITNCYVKNSTFNMKQGKNDETRANSEFIGVIGGKSKTTITNCGVENNVYTNDISWTPYHNPFVGGNRGGNAVLVVDGKTFQPVPTYTGETKFTDLADVTLDGDVIDDQVVKHISNATFETLILDETQNTVFLENVVIKSKLKLPVANTVLLKNVTFEMEKPFAFENGAYAAQFQFIAYTGTVKVKEEIVTYSNMVKLLGITTDCSCMITTW